MIDMSNKVQVGMRLPEELIQRVDAVRGDVSRTRWIERAIGHGLRAWEQSSRSSDPFASATVTVPFKDEKLGRAAQVPGVQPASSWVTASNVSASAHLPTCKCAVCKP